MPSNGFWVSFSRDAGDDSAIFVWWCATCSLVKARLTARQVVVEGTDPRGSERRACARYPAWPGPPVRRMFRSKGRTRASIHRTSPGGSRAGRPPLQSSTHIRCDSRLRLYTPRRSTSDRRQMPDRALVGKVYRRSCPSSSRLARRCRSCPSPLGCTRQ